MNQVSLPLFSHTVLAPVLLLNNDLVNRNKKTWLNDETKLAVDEDKDASVQKNHHKKRTTRS